MGGGGGVRDLNSWSEVSYSNGQMRRDTGASRQIREGSGLGQDTNFQIDAAPRFMNRFPKW